MSASRTQRRGSLCQLALALATRRCSAPPAAKSPAHAGMHAGMRAAAPRHHLAVIERGRARVSAAGRAARAGARGKDTRTCDRGLGLGIGGAAARRAAVELGKGVAVDGAARPPHGEFLEQVSHELSMGTWKATNS